MKIFVFHKNGKELSDKDKWKALYAFRERMRHQVMDTEIVSLSRYDKIANLIFAVEEGDYVAIIEPGNKKKLRETTYVEVSEHLCNYLLLDTKRSSFEAIKQYSQDVT